MTTEVQALTLAQLLKALEPAMLKVQRADETFAAAKAAAATAKEAATAARTASIASANNDRNEAIRRCQAAIDTATAVHDEAVLEIRRGLEQAEADHAAACVVADPLLKEINARAERVASVAARSTA